MTPKDVPILFIFIVGLLGILHIAAMPEKGSPLSDFITHYEPLFYDFEDLQLNHRRSKRSISSVICLNLEAHGRDFKLRLRRDTSVFSSDLMVENSTGQIYYDTSKAYIGDIEGEPGSHVHGVLTQDGLFEGKISTESEQYVIEKADRYFHERQPFHSVMYKHSDVRTDSLKASLCHADELHRKLRQWQTDEASSRQSTTLQHNNAHTKSSTQFLASDAASAIQNRNSSTGEGAAARRRRAIDPTKTTCTLYIQADHLFYEKYGSNEERVIEQLTQHVQGVNQIYSIIDFDSDGKDDHINFIIKRIKVHTNPRSPDYKFRGNYGVESFLELFSEDNFDSYCLAYMFTYRDFEGGTLGLAWTGDLTNAGGVCERNGQFRGSLKSLNTGIVTVLNYGKDVPSSVSHVTMAHELGHNMGSQHDPETMVCSPGQPYGNYIMYARATSGDKPNNNQFSRCSQSSMSEIMAAKARGSNGCFIPVTSSICGNGVVEAGEDCDCGWEDECTDRCCFPQVEYGGIGLPCTRRPGALCSPTEGPCCSDRCTLIGVDSFLTCREESDCQFRAFCNGSSAACPLSGNKPDRLLCNGGSSVCHRGECTNSVCNAYGLESCQCRPELDGDMDDPSLCHVCCKLSGSYFPCRSSFEWNIPPYSVPDLMVRPGSPCYEYRGVCDVFHKCREQITQAGPLENLKSMFFSSEGFNSLKIWLATHWYVTVACVIGLIIFMIIFVKLCAPRRKKINTPAQDIAIPTDNSSHKVAKRHFPGMCRHEADKLCTTPLPTEV